jgi:hypothetical protein
MLQITDLKILTVFENTTGYEAKILKESKPRLRLQKHGVTRINVVPIVIPWWHEQSKTENLYDSLAFDVEQKSHWRTMMTTTNHLMSCGFANRATNNGTKN